MTETKLLDATFDLIDDNGTSKAYAYLVSKLDREDEWSSQVYNYLYCLAATSGNHEEAIHWLKEAIKDKGIWYRPEVFEDNDLDMIRNHSDFKACVEISNSRYEDELKRTKTKFTWNEKTEDNLLVILHGNQQNNEISRSFWSELILPNYQSEYLQSSEIDSYQLYRWNDDGTGPTQLKGALSKVEGVQYSSTVLSGFSAGCNTILRGITSDGVQCNRIILFSPWMPIVESMCDAVIMALKAKGIQMVLICGVLDEDCMPQCRLFEERAKVLGYEYIQNYIEGMSHEYPTDLVERVRQYIEHYEI